MDSTRTDVSTPYRVLLALGEEADARLISATLETVKSVLNFKVSRAATLREALSLQAREPQDVALVDLRLPDAGGLDALDTFRREASTVPVIAYARDAADCSPSLAAQRGAQDLLVRGAFDSYLLVRAVRYAAERRRSKDALRQHLDKLARYQSALLDLAK
ncbi:MAG: response regulator, partial [Planctomycetaceae bacterium]|nr:response regulator [Planctomycetaceae bacterium]